jgi:hypothetical protein
VVEIVNYSFSADLKDAREVGRTAVEETIAVK